MHEHLIAYMNNLLPSPLTAQDEAVVRLRFVPKRLRKHQFLLEAGEVCRTAGFIVKGAMKQYTVDDEGKEHILNLCVENWWVGDRESFVKQVPSKYFIDAVEDTDLLIIYAENNETVQHDLPFMKEVMNILSDRQALQLLKRVQTSKIMTAEERLLDLEHQYPQFLQRFPQHMVASYLGMTKETFSRIRSKMVRGA